jgi:hypothetical protein
LQALGEYICVEHVAGVGEQLGNSVAQFHAPKEISRRLPGLTRDGQAALIYTAMSGEPLFDPSLKKRSKKKQVAFSEDPLGAGADPTVPAPSLDNTTASGDVVDLGPKTVHEQMKQNEAGVDDVAPEPKEVKEEEDFKAMFGDLKKKKKKKEIPLDLVSRLGRLFVTVH